MEDKPLVSRRFAAFASVILVMMLALTLYYLAGGMRGGTANPFQPSTPPEEPTWELSPLVAQYRIGDITPTLVVNCRYVFIGSDARGEEKGVYPPGTERDNIGRALCFSTNDSDFCSKFGASTKYYSGERDFPLCNKSNRTVIYAFHNPLCPICAAQREVLDAFRNEFPGKVTIQYICVPTSDAGRDACASGFFIGKYDK